MKATMTWAIWTAALAGTSTVGAADDLERALTLLDQLDETVISVDHRQSPLGEVVSDLSASIGVPIQADWESLRRAFGTRARDEVTLQLDRAAASTALASLMLQLGDDFGRPVWEVNASQIVITSADGTAAMRLTDAYDVRDLLADGETLPQLREQVPGWLKSLQQEEAAADDADEPEGQDGDDGGVEPIELVDAGELDNVEPEPVSPAQELLEIVVDHIDPDAWVDFGGTRGKISDVRGVLMVTVPPTTHKRLRDALTRLRRADPVSVHLEAAIVDIPDAEMRRLRQRHDMGSRALARAVLRADSGTAVWRSATTVAAGQTLTVDSSADVTSVLLRVTPTPEVEKGVLTMAIMAETNADGDRRRVETEIAIPSRGAAVIELASASTTPTRRLLVIVPQR